ncbi:MAG: hypothetical protein R3C05_25520 [Pirellulaceae bacterium]
MAKYYIESGTMKTVVSADDAHKAALWAVHRAMQQVVPMYDDQSVTASEKSAAAMTQGVMVLDQRISISEVGFDRDDAQVVNTYDVVSQWNQLMVALSRLDNLA